MSLRTRELIIAVITYLLTSGFAWFAITVGMIASGSYDFVWSIVLAVVITPLFLAGLWLAGELNDLWTL